MGKTKLKRDGAVQVLVRDGKAVSAESRFFQVWRARERNRRNIRELYR